MYRFIAGFLALLVAVAGCQRKPEKGVIEIAAAADLKFALEEIRTEFQRNHPDIEIKLSFGSSGQFFAQLEQHAPFDMFLSADMDYPRRLVEAGLARKGSLFSYAVGHLVLWARRDSPLDVRKLGKEALLAPSVKLIAIANPRFAPYGRAAVAALKTWKLYDRLKDKIVEGESVAQAAQFAQSGNADLGLIALSQAESPTLREQGQFWEVPADDYPRIDQGGVILSWAKDLQAAEKFRAFLTGPRGKAILRRYGFALPEK